MTLHPSTFEYLQPTGEQAIKMGRCRLAARLYADTLLREVPAGVDRDFLLRELRQIAMWANVAITRNEDGSPREEGTVAT